MAIQDVSYLPFAGSYTITDVFLFEELSWIGSQLFETTVSKKKLFPTDLSGPLRSAAFSWR